MLVTPECRLSFPSLFRASANKLQPNAEPKFGATLLFKKVTGDVRQDLPELFNAMMACATEKWGADLSKVRLKSGILDGDKHNAKRVGEGKEPLAGFAGCWFVRGTSKIKPVVVDGARKIIPDLAEKTVVPGMYAYAQIHAFAWDNPAQGKGVSFGIDQCQVDLFKKYEPFVAAADPEKTFKPLATAAPGANDPKNYQQAPAAPAASSAGPFDT